jgi:NAD(P)-dependent dehydrogenase (short-subunit alcohol dehydrogenase family)
LNTVNDKTILITGSTDGIGKATALELADMGATIIIHGRDANLVKATIEDIQQTTQSKKLTSLVADFSSLKQVRDMANQIQSQYSRLDVLINNAGVFMKKRILSEDGFEMTFAVNHLAHFLLTNLLLDFMKKSTPARIITISSMVHTSAKLDFQNLNAERQFNPYSSYALSKLANVLFSKELSKILEGTRVTSNSLHPGVVGTKMLRYAFNMSGASVQEGAATSVYLASSPELAAVTGKYFVNRREDSYSPLADDDQLRRKFWEISKSMVGL